MRASSRDETRVRMKRIVAEIGDAWESVGDRDSARLAPVEQWQPRREGAVPAKPAGRLPSRRRKATWADRGLLVIEVLALTGSVVAVVLSFGSLRHLRQGFLVGLVGTVAQLEPGKGVAWGVPSAVPAFLPVSSEPPTATASPTTRTALALPTATLQPAEVLLPAGRTSPTATATSTVTPVPSATPGATPVSPTGVRFVIPAIGVDAPMVEGDDWESLKSGIGHRIGSAWPGENGNVVISAHNDVYGAIFRDLKNLRPGDLVYVYTPKGTFRYEVLFTRLVLPTEVSVTNPTRQPILTMITCYPPYVDTHRIVVTAKLVP